MNRSFEVKQGDSAMLRRVRKSENDAPAAIAEDKYFYCLDCWKLFMSRNDGDLSAKGMALPAGPVEDKEAYSSDAADEQYREDLRIGAAAHASIHSMPRLHWWALYRQCSITTQWNFPNAAWVDIVIHAETNLREKLKNNLVTQHLFR
jgi:hypothetical protein